PVCRPLRSLLLPYTTLFRSNDATTGEFSMSMYAVSDKRPEESKYVRVTVAETHYFFRPQGEDKTEMTWLQHTEPGGSIPSWLVKDRKSTRLNSSHVKISYAV